MPTVTGIATEFITFTRASNATVTDSDGLVKWAPHNLLTNSESFDASSWVKGNATIAANSAVAPNGTTTADRVYPTINGSGRGVNQRVLIAGSTNYSVSIYAKAAGKNFIAFTDLAAGDFRAWVNLSTGAKTETAGYFVTVTGVGNGWYNCVFTQTATAANPYAYVVVCDADSSVAVTVNGTDGVYLWGAALYRSDLAMQPNTSAYPMYNPTTPKNLLGYTQDFSNAAWTKSGLVTAGMANVTTAPDGTTTADQLIETAATAIHYAEQSAGATTAATNYTVSVAIKANGRQFATVSFTGATSTLWVAATFDLSGGGSVSNTGNGSSATYVSSSITSLGSGWFRCTVTGSLTSASTGVFTIQPSNSGTPTYSGYSVHSYTGDGTSGIYVWGAQLSDSASLDSYVPVYGAAVTSAAYYGPRRDFDPVTLACKGLLVEEQRTNLQLNSNVFGTSTFAATVVAGAAASPSGLIDASSLACTSTSGRAILSTSVTSGIVYTFSVFIKSGTNTSAFIELAGTAGSGGAVVFNLSSGTVTSGTGGAIVPAPNGFYRCSVTSTATGTGASDMRIGTGDATSKTVFVYGAQLEANASFATSYIPTPAAATATRNADVASVSTQAFPYSATEGTVVVNASSPCIAAIANMITLDNGTTQERIRLLTDVASVKTIVTESNTTQANLSPGSATANTPFKFAVAYKVNDFAAVVNGSAAATDAAGNVPVVNIARLGADSSGNYLNGHIRQITYLPRRLANAELQARTV